jgi:hypothetical protein
VVEEVNVLIVDVVEVWVVTAATDKMFDAKSPLLPVIVTTYSPGNVLVATVNEAATMPPDTEQVWKENMLGVMVQLVS